MVLAGIFGAIGGCLGAELCGVFFLVFFDCGVRAGFVDGEVVFVRIQTCSLAAERDTPAVKAFVQLSPLHLVSPDLARNSIDPIPHSASVVEIINLR